MAESSKQTVNWPLATLLIVTLLIRATVLWSLRSNFEQDPDAYREIAENLLLHGEFALGRGEDDSRPTAYRPPLYPVVLSNLPTSDGQHVSLPKVALLHLLLGAATVWLTWLTAQRLVSWAMPTVGPGRRTGPAPPVDAAIEVGWNKRSAVPPSLLAPLLAALLIALDPILLNQQSLVMTETLATFVAILSLWCLTRYTAHPCWFNAALAGGSIGLAILCRPTFLPWLALLVPAIAFAPTLAQCCGSLGWGRSPDRATPPDRQVSSSLSNTQASLTSPKHWRSFAYHLSNSVVVALFAAAILSPWAIRNYRLFGKPIVTTTHGGYTLLLGNNSSFYNWLTLDRSGLPWNGGNVIGSEVNWLARSNRVLSMNSAPTVSVPQTELEMDSMSYDIARRMIREQPRTFVLACLYRITQLWSPLPHKLTADESLSRRLLRYATCIWYLAVYALAAIGIWKLRWNLIKPPWLYGILLCLAFTAVHTFYWTNLRMRAPLMPVITLLAAAALLPTAKPLRSSA